MKIVKKGKAKRQNNKGQKKFQTNLCKMKKLEGKEKDESCF